MSIAIVGFALLACVAMVIAVAALIRVFSVDDAVTILGARLMRLDSHAWPDASPYEACRCGHPIMWHQVYAPATDEWREGRCSRFRCTCPLYTAMPTNTETIPDREEGDAIMRDLAKR